MSCHLPKSQRQVDGNTHRKTSQRRGQTCAHGRGAEREPPLPPDRGKRSDRVQAGTGPRFAQPHHLLELELTPGTAGQRGGFRWLWSSTFHTEPRSHELWGWPRRSAAALHSPAVTNPSRPVLAPPPHACVPARARGYLWVTVTRAAEGWWPRGREGLRTGGRSMC